jgi:ketosteroid isomerase-like protein
MLDELYALNDRWNRAWFEKDASTVETLMASDYIYVAPTGFILDRVAIMRIIRTASYQLGEGAHTETVVRPLGSDAGVIRRRWKGTGTFEGTSFTEDHKCVMICQKRGGEWRIVMEQSSLNNK